MKSNYLKSPLIVFLFFNSISILADEITVTPYVGKNSGEFIQESVPQFAFIKGSGSRLTYRLDYDFAGFGMRYSSGRWELSGKILSTGKQVDGGGARDEDFYIYPWAEFMTNDLLQSTDGFYKYRDTAHTIRTQSFNYVDFNYVSSEIFMIHYDIHLRFYPFYKASDTHKETQGLFLGTGINYTYIFTAMGDGIYLYPFSRKINPWITYNNRYLIMFYNHIYELPLGFGYKYKLNRFSFVGDFYFVLGRNKTKEIYLISEKFFSDIRGTGFNLNIEFSYRIANDYKISIEYLARRLFLSGTTTSFSRFLGLSWRTFDSYHNLKENRVQLGVSRIFSLR